jgi:hypothetical protein
MGCYTGVDVLVCEVVADLSSAEEEDPDPV